MNKYIPADKLVAEIERRIGICKRVTGDERNEEDMRRYYQGKVVALEEIRHLAASLQQEQPNKYETALEKARKWMPNVNQGGHAILIDIFPELGEGLDPRYGGRKQEQPEVELDKLVNEEFASRCRTTEYGLVATYNRAELYQFIKRMAIVFNARKEE